MEKNIFVELFKRNNLDFGLFPISSFFFVEKQNYKLLTFFRFRNNKKFPIRIKKKK